MPKTIFHFFLFTSVYISLCALLMIWQTNQLLILRYPQTTFYYFVFFSTICSYNFHWYLTPGTYLSSSERIRWGARHRTLLLCLSGIGMIGALYFFWQLRQYWLVISFSAVLTFLYSAPKVPHKAFKWLSKIAVGKTLFLTFVWTYVTTLLPALIADLHVTPPVVYFTLHRFFLIYAICILFDYRDVEADRKEGIRSLITYLNTRELNRLYYGILLLAAICALRLLPYTTTPVLISLLIPVAATALITHEAHHRPSDYLFYFVLDGFMALSALLHLISSW
ncbi:UbiA family prenyltransferase [Chitinophaga nivalis]|uniref:UbiA family prenyltransferase n=1 Tax=Chitinophaga nivalis TaxID=2991709 RepID=A0ABT3IR20_9BACT|nr:UbiA family prenyltransferase [Chitinophaga nivalis]MCW3463883.1 UbiA family prenyltransferase [Chitinophaga nivalis]MCW3486427.1 UbiA family prenyltransferase [Chitinophaga nivalis]